MNSETPERSTKEPRKRLLSSPKEVSDTKRQKDLLEGNLEDFLEAIDDELDDLNHRNTKPEVNVDMATNKSANQIDIANLATVLARIELKLDTRLEDLDLKLKIKDDEIS